MLTVRPMTAEDVPACVAILNDIIARGGSTAYEEPYTEVDFTAHYVDEAPVRMTALDGDRIVGFQAAFDYGAGLYSIGTFADRRDPVSATGRTLFAATLAACRARGGDAILARITSDNAGGLAFYSRMGFRDIDVIPGDVVRRNGTVVDRIVKRYDL